MKQTFYIFLFISILFSCGKSGPKLYEHAGGTFRFAIASEPTTLLAREVNDYYSNIVLAQVLEGLVALNPKTLEPEPALASSWDISDDGLTITFLVRDDVFFHQNDLTGSERKLTTEDVKYSIELACKQVMGGKPSSAYKSVYQGLLKGAEAFHNGEKDEIEGLQISSDKVIMQLEKRDANFLDKLASINAAIVLKEMVEQEREADLIGTGPFKFGGFIEDDEHLKIVLVKNENYYLTDEKGHQLPYLDSVVYIVEAKNLQQLELFEEGKTHLIEELPPSRITAMLEGRIEDFNKVPPRLLLRRKPLLATEFYHFNLLNEVFQDVRVRQAINYAVDKVDIMQNVINNQAYGIGDAGLVPPAAFPGYNSKEVREFGYTFNPEKARKLLAEAGYPNGEGFPTINLKFNIGTNNSGVADRFAKHMKKYLNINVSLDGVSFEDRIRDQANADGDLFRMTWIADYYSPETFLMNAYGATVPADQTMPSLLNNARYVNAEFDVAFEAGQKSTNIMERYKYFAEAEKIMMQDAPFIVLWYAETIKVADARVRNLYLNEMNHYIFRDIYIKDWTTQEFDKFAQQEN